MKNKSEDCSVDHPRQWMEKGVQEEKKNKISEQFESCKSTNLSRLEWSCRPDGRGINQIKSNQKINK